MLEVSKSLLNNKKVQMDLDTQFQEAFEKISKLKKAVAPGVILKFYNFYKQAYFGNNLSLKNVSDLRNGFKFNA